MQRVGAIVASEAGEPVRSPWCFWALVCMYKSEHFVRVLLFGVLLISCAPQPARDAESISQEGAIVPSPTQEGASLDADEEPDPNARIAAEEAQLQQLRASFPEAPVLRPVSGARLLMSLSAICYQ